VKRISHSEELETASLISFNSLPHRPNTEMDHKDFLTKMNCATTVSHNSSTNGPTSSLSLSLSVQSSQTADEYMDLFTHSTTDVANLLCYNSSAGS